MKTLVTFLAIAIMGIAFLPNLQAQNDPEYVVVDYMKIKPGMQEKYLECEAAWKLVHEYRKKQGLILGWQLDQVVFPAGTGTEYDYMTITQYKNWKAMGADWTTWYEDALKTLPADLREVAENANLYRDLVKSEIWTGGERVSAPGSSKPKYFVENYMSIPADGWDDWEEMETKFVLPVHKKNIELGNRAGWFIGYLVMPRGDSYPYQASTVDTYDNWEDIGKNESEAWEMVYPGMSEERIWGKIEPTRTIVKTEIRMLVDSLE